MNELILTIGLVTQSGLIAAVCVFALWRKSEDSDNVNLMRMIQGAHDRIMSKDWSEYTSRVTIGDSARVQDPPVPVATEDEILGGGSKDTEDDVAEFK